MQRFHSLASRISLSIALLGTLVFIAVIGTNYLVSRGLIEDYIAGLARTTASSTAAAIESIFNGVAGNADALAEITSQAGFNEPLIHDSIKAFLKTNPDIYGSTVALEPGQLAETVGEFSPYYFQSDTGLGYSDLASENYQYLTWDWYTVPKIRQHAVWSEPYYDEGGGNVLMITYSTLIKTPADNRFAGIATTDIALGWLQQLVEQIRIGETGYGMIVTSADTIVAHPITSLNMRKLQSLVDPQVINTMWQEFESAVMNQRSAYVNLPCWDNNGQCWVAIEPLTNSGWKVMIVVPERELVSDIVKLTGIITALAIAGLIFLVIIIISVTHRLTRPLAGLTRVTAEIGRGNLDIVLPNPERNDEIGTLTQDFSSMRDALRHHIEQLQETTARQQRLESEIEIASDIQMSMIPGSGSITLQSEKHQLFATLRPARSVGGDLYYLQQEDNLLHFIIGDVSGKGVPAALFMAKTVTLYTGELNDYHSPGETLEHMNNALAQDNNACMFVTALCGTLEIDTGKLRIGNAGHMNPIQVTGRGTGELDVEGGPVLGVVEDMDFPTIEYTLAPGTTLVMYTDGVSEAFNTAHEQYKTERLATYVAKSVTIDAEPLGKGILEDIAGFVGDAKQSDDLTLLVITYNDA